MIAWGGGKNGSGSQANFAVATSHTANSSPSAASHGARCFRAAPTRPSRLPPIMPAVTPPATANAAMPRASVRDQSPRSCHARHARPKPIHATPANMPARFSSDHFGSAGARPMNAAPSSADCGNATVADAEQVDMDPLRKLCRVGAGLEHGHLFQVVGVSFQFLLEDVADRMMMMGVIADHRLQIVQAGCLRRVGLE